MSLARFMAAVEAAAVEHVATCERCQAVLSGTQAVIAVAPAAARLSLPPADRDALLQRILSSLDGSGQRDG